VQEPQQTDDDGRSKLTGLLLPKLKQHSRGSETAAEASLSFVCCTQPHAPLAHCSEPPRFGVRTSTARPGLKCDLPLSCCCACASCSFLTAGLSGTHHTGRVAVDTPSSRRLRRTPSTVEIQFAFCRDKFIVPAPHVLSAYHRDKTVSRLLCTIARCIWCPSDEN